jgi:hypothetical protein
MGAIRRCLASADENAELNLLRNISKKMREDREMNIDE